MPTALLTRLRADLSDARRSRDRERVLVLSTIIADVQNNEIGRGRKLNDAEVLEIVARGIKQRKETAAQARTLGRSELATNEEARAAILQVYLPSALSEEEVRTMVRRAISGGMTQLGPVMGRLMPKIKGRFDGREANRIVREELAR